MVAKEAAGLQPQVLVQKAVFSQRSKDSKPEELLEATLEGGHSKPHACSQGAKDGSLP